MAGEDKARREKEEGGVDIVTGVATACRGEWTPAPEWRPR